MLETEHNSDDYEESNTSSWPKSGYKFNKEKSGCIDNSGSTIEDSLSYDSTTNIVTVDTGVTTKCYIYFDKRYSLEELCTSGEDTLGECLTNNNSTIESLNDNVEGGLYRYQGTQEIVDDNYICFGTTSKEECTSNTDAYMYRVIGVTSENNDTLGLETNQLKLIKGTSIGEYEWHNDYTTNTKWEESTMYSYLQNDILSNVTYFPNGWSNKIDYVKWNVGDVQDVTNGEIIIELETSAYTNTSSKLGLIYLSDYYYAYNSGGESTCTNLGNCLNWINDNISSIWTMTRYGESTVSYHDAWYIWASGGVSIYRPTLTRGVRPVFYLTSNETYASGNGTIEDPIIIGKTKGLCENGDNLGNCLIENNSKIESLDNTAYSGMYRYTGTDEVVNNNYICFGTSNKRECLNNPDKYMYRMIGVTSEDNTTLGLETGQVKLIKDTSIGTHEWHSSYSTDTKWESSTMYSYLQGSDVLGNADIIESGWSNKIDSVKWNIGDVQIYTNGDTVYGLEDNSQTTNTSKIGLIYLSDYYYAYSTDGTINCNSTVCTNWLTDTANNTWTMSRYGYYSTKSRYYAWTVLSDGTANIWSLLSALEVIPTFYLNDDEIFVSGMGTKNDPVIIKENASETIIRKDTESDIGLQQEIITGDDLYRFSGTSGNIGINNYVCLGTTSKCESGSDNMYRIIGVNPNNGELKVIKEIPWNNSTTYAWHSSITNVTWLTSSLYTGTVKGIYNGLSFKDMIVTNHSWNVGTANSTSIATRESIIDYENNATGTADIGILSLTDYYLAYNGDRNWYSEYDITTNWIGGYLNGNVSNYEWTMTYYDFYSLLGDYSVYGVRYNNGNALVSRVTDTYIIRPTFYLKPNVYITNPNATGSSTDPFILSY